MSKSNRVNNSKSITYITRKVDTSVVILKSPEDEVVVDALRYLLKFVNVQAEYSSCLQQYGILEKLLHLLDRDICILRLALKLLGILLTFDDILEEVDQGTYDSKILTITDMYRRHEDDIVRLLCLSVLSKLAKSNRIVHLIFKNDLFYYILETSRETKDPQIFEWNLEFFSNLLSIPAAIEVLPEISDVDLIMLLNDLESSNKDKIIRLYFEIVHQLTYYCIEAVQKMFRETILVEKMLDVVMDPKKEEYHNIAFDIIINCMRSNETSDYFIESLQFLKFCQWAKKCQVEYHFPCISILEKLTRIPSRKQILFDLSVEQSILSFFRSTEKSILNKTCEAITNMIPHKYCREEMFKPVVLKALFYILLRNDEVDPANEVALKTILTFTRKSLNALDMIYRYGAHKVLLGYFKKNDNCASETIFLGVMEILNKLSLHRSYQQDVIGTAFIDKLFNLFQKASTNISTFASEIMLNLRGFAEFKRIFLVRKGPKIFVDALQPTKDKRLLRNVLLFIYKELINEDIRQIFLHNGLVKVLREFPEYSKLQLPILNKVLKLIYNQHLPMKFFYTNKLEITDKLQDKFYLIDGQYKANFPFPEDLEKVPRSSLYAVYVVDYSCEVKYEDENSGFSSISPTKISSERTMSTLTQISSSLSSYFRRKSYDINYGKLSSDPFLPRYISNANKYLVYAETMKEKVKMLAKYVDAVLCTPVEGYTKIEKIHHVKLHVEFLKQKLGSNLIPVGFLRLGGHCERALLFKAMADKCRVACTLEKGKSRLYWNEVFLLDTESRTNALKLYVVDLTKNIGNLLVVGSRAANQYCDIMPWTDNLTEWFEKDIII